MGWHGIQNLPPGFDALAGKGGGSTIVDKAIKGEVPGLSPGQRDQFKDLKRHLLHQDYARFFETSMNCASLLLDLDRAKYLPLVTKEIIEPALKVGVEQMESIRKEVAKFAASKRKMEYDPVSSLGQIHTKCRPIALAYPTVEGASQVDSTFESVLQDLQKSSGANAA